MTKISFIIVAYNAAGSIGALLDDLLAQTIPHEQIEALRYAKAPADFDKDRLLAHCPFFRVERLMLTDSSATLPAQKMSHLLCLDGNADLRCGNEYFPVKKGDSYLIPACLCGVTLSGTATLLLSSLD